MRVETAVAVAVAIIPVGALLAVLLYLDSYKLVKLRSVVAAVVGGVAMALLAYVVNGYAVMAGHIDGITLSRYVAPVTEELLKGALIVALVRARRIGFLVDAAIFGFAVGTGFSLLENVYYLQTARDAGIGTFVVRGFGTALMHGGATSIFGVAGLALTRRAPTYGVLAFVPGALVAIILHSTYNHLFVSPRVATIVIVLAVPILLQLIFDRSSTAMGEWLGAGFDADAEMLALIDSGRFADSPIGRYLHTLKTRFSGPVVADVLCYLQLYTELSLRAKGMLMMRENGFDVNVDDETKAKFAEMRYLEGSIGHTALLAIRPMLHMKQDELWQVYSLEH